MNDPYDTHESTVRGAYENSASYAASATLGDLIGTNVHVEAEFDDLESGTYVAMTPLTTSEIVSLVERDTCDWLLS